MKSTLFKIASVVVTYNRKGDLIKTINSILLQDPDLDIIIVDNNSSDGTKDFVGGMESPRIHYLRQNENLGSAGGFAAGMRFGITKNYDFVWLFNDDSRPVENTFISLKPAIKELHDSHLG